MSFPCGTLSILHIFIKPYYLQWLDKSTFLEQEHYLLKYKDICII